ncbi:hypothetical protein ACFXHA_40960 [Nocardia sp. NPDC059240]|uniref:hypothetical protein n=1 Tax=Nocardia sp. NPDC059240 TaxID=3346786 RepID=UPI0036C0CFBC
MPDPAGNPPPDNTTPPPEPETSASLEPAAPQQISESQNSGDKQLTLWVAGIAAIAALLGSTIGGTTTWLVAREQVDAQSSQYIRTERKTFYSAVVDKLVVMQGLEDELVTTNIELYAPLSSANPPGRVRVSADSLVQFVGRYQVAYNDLHNGETSMSLLGSSDARVAFFSGLGQRESLLHELNATISIMRGENPGATIDTTLTGVRSATVAIRDHDGAFVQAARTDIGLSTS